MIASTLAGIELGFSKTLDSGTLGYTQCLRDTMSKRLRDLPENTYFEFKRSDLLRKIERPTTGASQSDHADTQK